MRGRARLLVGAALMLLVLVLAHAALVAGLQAEGRVGRISAATCGACHGGR
jgi:hypothetical protein